MDKNFTQAAQRLRQRASLVYMSTGLAWAIIGLGVLLRLAQYWANRSLWLDEAFVALDVRGLSFLEFLQPSLRTNFTVPFGFLVIEKIIVQALGPSEYALRLLPLLSGIVASFPFYGLAKRYLDPKAVPIALGLFAILDPLVYYASDGRPYSSDVAVGLILGWVAARVQERKLTLGRVLLFGVLGAVAVWISNPAVFVLAGIGGSLILSCVIHKRWAALGRLAVACLMWASSFVLCYLMYLDKFSIHPVLLETWGERALPFPPLSVSDVTALVRTFFALFEQSGGMTLPGIGAFAFLVGCVSGLQTKKGVLFALLLSVLVTAVASRLGKYPFKGRLWLFLVPFVLLFVAEGAQQIVEKTRGAGALIGIVFLALLFYHPLYEASYHLIHPRTVEEITPVISYVKEHKLDSDVLYVYGASNYAFKFYAEQYGFDNSDYTVGIESNSWADLVGDLDRLRSSERVWLLSSHTVPAGKAECFLAYLDHIGHRLDSFQSAGASVYLYDLEGN
jgi:hypothetical protein